MPLCVRIVLDHRHGQGGIATIANQENMGPRGLAPLTLLSGRRDGLRPGLANYLELVVGKDIGLPYSLHLTNTATEHLYTAHWQVLNRGIWGGLGVVYTRVSDLYAFRRDG